MSPNSYLQTPILNILLVVGIKLFTFTRILLCSTFFIVYVVNLVQNMNGLNTLQDTRGIDDYLNTGRSILTTVQTYCGVQQMLWAKHPLYWRINIYTMHAIMFPA